MFYLSTSESLWTQQQTSSNSWRADNDMHNDPKKDYTCTCMIQESFMDVYCSKLLHYNVAIYNVLYMHSSSFLSLVHRLACHCYLFSCQVTAQLLDLCLQGSNLHMPWRPVCVCMCVSTCMYLHVLLQIVHAQAAGLEYILLLLSFWVWPSVTLPLWLLEQRCHGFLVNAHHARACDSRCKG